jgi:hypothetical protein
MTRRSPVTTRVWRVRGYRGDVIAHTRVYQREAPAVANYIRCHDYYDRVTIEVAEVGEFQPVKPMRWWWL